MFHSMRVCQVEGIPLEQFIDLLGKPGKGYEKGLVENIHSGNYRDTSAPLELWQERSSSLPGMRRKAESTPVSPGWLPGSFRVQWKRVTTGRKSLLFSKYWERGSKSKLISSLFGKSIALATILGG
jgi:hypothetical protein